VPELDFQVDGAAPIANAATPQLAFKLRIANSMADAVHSIALRVQVQIEPMRRRYTPDEQRRLRELFGEPERWSQTLQCLLWTSASVPVPAFTKSVNVDVPVPCTFDFNVAVTKYIHGLDEGEIAISLLFSGTVFYAGARGLQVMQIPWEKEARFRLPVSVWKQMMDLYYPNTAWLALRRDALQRLYEYRAEHGLATWEQALERLLPAKPEKQP